MLIFGAGLAGLLAGTQFQTATILEAGPEGHTAHKALLRFRTSAVGDSLGIPFRRVCVRKGIWFDGEFVPPSIEMANCYSRKVIGRFLDRSIWNIDSVERYIAPENLIEQLIERCGKRILWQTPVNESVLRSTKVSSDCAISTIPMSAMVRLASFVTADEPTFQYASIHVRRYRIPNADVYQTIYYPTRDSAIYRASITGSLAIVEYSEHADEYPWWEAFGLYDNELEPIESSTQRFGKIAPIDDDWRRQFIFDLSQRDRIFSLGRFATWRNILLDDVLADLSVIRKLMTASAYSARLSTI